MIMSFEEILKYWPAFSNTIMIDPALRKFSIQITIIHITIVAVTIGCDNYSFDKADTYKEYLADPSKFASAGGGGGGAAAEAEAAPEEEEEEEEAPSGGGGIFDDAGGDGDY